MSFTGERSFQSLYKKLSSHICQQNLMESCSTEFAALDNNLDRVDYLLNLQGAKELLKLPPNSSKKDLSKALKLKGQGNNYFQKKNNHKAILVYNEAIKLTPISDNNGLLAVCFANRSAVLYSMGRHKECLADIDTAIDKGYPSEMQYKLLSRKAKCYQYIASNKFKPSVKDALDSLEYSSLDSTGRELWQHEISKLTIQKGNDIFTSSSTTVVHVDQSNPQYPTLNDRATVCESKEFGRYVRAEEDLQVGSVVLVETPYCSVTLPDSYLTHCNRCQKSTDIVHPCRKCADVVYCGKDCESVSWEQWHQYECYFSRNLKRIDINMGHLALRTALKAGYKTLAHILEGNFHQLGHCEYYEDIYLLQGHEEDRSSKDLFWRTAAAIVLAQQCNAMAWSESADNGLSILATFVLHHMQVFPCNAHEISQVEYNETQPSQSGLVEIGAGIYATLSLFNHSCDPLVVRTFHEGNKCVMKSISPIHKSEQIYDNYGCLHATHPIKDRQEKLLSQYYFSCCCTSCMQDWSLYSKLSYTDAPLYKCTDCQSMVLPPFTGFCDHCNATFSKPKVDAVLAKAKSQLDSTLVVLFTESYKQFDITKHIDSLEKFSLLANSLVFRPYKALCDCQEALKHLYSLLGNVEYS